MNFQNSLTSNRLLIELLTLNDHDFIFELVNTDGWIKYIGNRNVFTVQDATAYIKKIINNPEMIYWVVKLKANNTAIGIITLIKRDYLDHHDIGFAFLPDFFNSGYAFEAANAVLNDFISKKHAFINAIIVQENLNSIKLLKRLGLQFEKEITRDKEKLQVYGCSSDTLNINQITNSFFEIFTNTGNRTANLSLLENLCIPEIIFICKTEATHTVYNLDSFIEPRKKILTDGTLIEFKESETSGQTHIVNNIAQRACEYQKSGILNGVGFKQKGHKLLQFLKTKQGWKITSVTWEDY